MRSIQGRAFMDVATKMGIGRRIATRNKLAAWIDFDNDGYPDLLLGEALYHNEQGKHFTEVTQQSGLSFDFECMGAVTADYDGDGLLDLYVLYQRDHKTETLVKETWINESQSGKANVLWRNVGGGRFVDVTVKANVGGGRRFSHAASWFFYDQDRWPDLYIANDFGRNVILRNKGDGSFVDVSAETGASDFATSMGVAT
ncbi:MAG: VCBS repeat-containing protein, partial [Pirellulaceae bacterium]